MAWGVARHGFPHLSTGAFLEADRQGIAKGVARGIAEGWFGELLGTEIHIYPLVLTRRQAGRAVPRDC